MQIVSDMIREVKHIVLVRREGVTSSQFRNNDTVLLESLVEHDETLVNNNTVQPTIKQIFAKCKRKAVGKSKIEHELTAVSQSDWDGMWQEEQGCEEMIGADVVALYPRCKNDTRIGPESNHGVGN